jgi:hypothetical protein
MAEYAWTKVHREKNRLQFADGLQVL